MIFHLLRCPEHFFNLQRQIRQAKLLVTARLSDYLVIDCSFAEDFHANDPSLGNYYQRLQLKIHSCFTSLYRYHSPSFVILCNVSSKDNDHCLQNSPFCHATASSYLNLFPREQLVYLSPDSPNVMTKYEHDVIYILGGIFQKSSFYLERIKIIVIRLISSKERTIDIGKSRTGTNSTSIITTSTLSQVLWNTKNQIDRDRFFILVDFHPMPVLFYH